ncbi:MAG TPA: hypothetical protein VL241_09995, partial [Gemmatimonadales bacterium]|nr:hypothetical protein [Gemmatimonadales bacterium]
MLRPFAAVLLVAACSHRLPAPAAPANPSPLAATLAQFTDPAVPARGPAEAEPIPRSWPEPTA